MIVAIVIAAVVAYALIILFAVSFSVAAKRGDAISTKVHAEMLKQQPASQTADSIKNPANV